MIYTADSLALAALEILVHLPQPELLKLKFQRIPVKLDIRLVKSLNLMDLPADWDILPPPESTQTIGTEWAVKKKSVLLKVPSTIIREEFNYLINPLHPDFIKLFLRYDALTPVFMEFCWIYLADIAMFNNAVMTILALFQEVPVFFKKIL